MTVGGSIFVYNCASQDYCMVEAIRSLQAACDMVSVVDAGSLDQTVEILKTLEDHKTKITYLSHDEWESQKGKEKLAYFTNKAIELLDTDYSLNGQADEVWHEDSFPFIRQAIELGSEGFLTRRYNLWNTPWQMLNVVQSRKPCSSEIIRLAKTKYRSIGDGESVAIDPPLNIDFLDKIECFHMGYVRDPYIMKKKVIHIQEQIFGLDHDKKLDLSDKFEPLDYFSEDDLVPIRKPLPIYVRQWAQDRYPNINHV